MALLTNDILRISARFKNSVVGDVMNVFYVQCDGPAADTDVAVMTAVETWLDTAYSNLSVLSDTNVPFDYKVDLVERDAGVVKIVRHIGTRAWVVTTPPAASGDPMPQGVAGIVNFDSSSPFVRGRKYIGTFTDGSADGDTIVAASLSAIVDFAADVLADIPLAVALLKPGVISLVRDGAAFDGFFKLFGAVANPIVGYLRRRKRGVGS